MDRDNGSADWVGGRGKEGRKKGGREERMRRGSEERKARQRNGDKKINQEIIREIIARRTMRMPQKKYQSIKQLIT